MGSFAGIRNSISLWFSEPRSLRPCASLRSAHLLRGQAALAAQTRRLRRRASLLDALRRPASYRRARSDRVQERLNPRAGGRRSPCRAGILPPAPSPSGRSWGDPAQRLDAGRHLQLSSAKGLPWRSRGQQTRPSRGTALTLASSSTAPPTSPRDLVKAFRNHATSC